jgi:hypothetical protein
MSKNQPLTHISADKKNPILPSDPLSAFIRQEAGLWRDKPGQN